MLHVRQSRVTVWGHSDAVPSLQSARLGLRPVAPKLLLIFRPAELGYSAGESTQTKEVGGHQSAVL